jgi:NAD(P)-dependent dehydrogenase (short-subunit alcohol dehydrogenase family)
LAVVFITGGGRGIGQELALQYAAAGDRVIVGVRDSRAVGNRLSGIEVLELDVSDYASVAALARALSAVDIDLLINNAGVIGPSQQSARQMDFSGFAEALAINTLGPLRVTQALLPNLRRAPNAKLAVLTSKMGSLSYAKSDRVAYRASKAAANKVTQCLATDLQEEGIAVAAIHPGWVRTEMGGADADIDAADSAVGIRTVIANISLSNTGRFWNYDGAELAW